MTETSHPERHHRKVWLGRAMAVTAISLAVYGAVTLVVLGRADAFPQGVAMFGVYAVGFGALAWLAIPRHPDNRAVWVPAWAAVFAGIGTAGWATTVLIADRAGLDVSASAWPGLAPADFPRAAAMSYEVVQLASIVAPLLMLTLWPLLFPEGRLRSPRWRWVAWAAVSTTTAAAALLIWIWRPASTVTFATQPEDLPGLGRLTLPLLSLAIVIMVISMASLVLRHRHSTGDTRHQYRWVGLGTVVLFASWLVLGAGRWQLLGGLAGAVIGVACYAVAVTKYHLYDIDVFVSRTLVYGMLAGFIAAVYVLVVVVVGGLLGSGTGNLVLALVAMALVAVTFEPARRRVQGWANRLVYGTRATPYEVLSRLTRRLAGTEPSEGILARMTRLVAEGTGATRSTVWLVEGDHLAAAAGWPRLPQPATAGSMDALAGFAVPVTHDERLVGALQVIKERGNPVTPTEERLLTDLAGSAGLVLRNQRLNADLASRADEIQESLRRLVEVQDAERRRLERDLHDGAQQQVVALKLKIAFAGLLAKNDRADDLAGDLDGLAAEAQAALDEIRALAKGIYPPLLEAAGLTAALQAQADLFTVPVEITAGEIGHYSKDVESALYFAAVEAMTNATRHASPSQIDVALAIVDDTLGLVVSDDGAGFDPACTPEGTGLTSVRDRVEALGGVLRLISTPGAGTTVSVGIPLQRDAGSVEARPLVTESVG